MKATTTTTINHPEATVSETQFWELIALIDWSQLGDDDAVVQPLMDRLMTMSAKDIFAFDDHMASKLHALDTEAHARNMGEYSYRGPEEHFSVDLFLYTRCAVVANGREAFEKILSTPEEFPEDAEFEALLYVAQTTYESKTGAEYPHAPEPGYETFSNKSGWT